MLIDLDLLDCLRREKLISTQNFIRLIKMFGVILEIENHSLISKEIWYLVEESRMVVHGQLSSLPFAIVTYRHAKN